MVLSSCSGEPPSTSNTEEKPDAQRLYNIHCAACHKPDGTGGISGAKSLVDSELSLAEIENVVLNGQGDMMPFSSILNNDEVNAIAHYAHGFKK